MNAAAGQTLDPWQLVLGASPVVQLVLLILVLMLVACLYIIGAKLIRFKRVTEESQRFLEMFWAEGKARTWDTKAMTDVQMRASEYSDSPIATVFRAGYRELARIAGTGTPDAADVDNVERALRRAQNAELTRLESKVSFLATTGSTAPFVGLFGTVWGVMNSFIAIHGHKSATLDVVAPGIAEALIATAVGLAAAIPAVMAYNYFVRRIRVVESEVDAFASDYLNIIRRHILAG